MAQDSFLNQQETSAVPGTEPTETKPQVTVQDMVGEGKKFDDVDQLALGKYYADQHIENLKAQLAEKDNLIQDLRSRSTTFDAVKDELSNLTKGQSTNQEAAHQPSEEDRNKPGVDIGQMVRQELEAQKKSDTVAGNVQLVEAKLLEAYGSEEKAAEGFVAVAKAMGMPPEWLLDVAGRNPDAFFKMHESTRPKAEGTSAPIPSSVNLSGASAGGTSKPGTYKHYMELKKEMGTNKFYSDHKLQARMAEDAGKEGFYG